ncbi:hypothetical protein TSAR_000607 [Trichomalopsis sarcophagae]|uniref:Uncharacterized protein n=1 Tax=Trichomalopsis sarcophagae TaxID=543379 RepID=A0A232EJW1_9HYME|nr:hypothetical protein TSAR_000607 [Trichomalopsis sarcophagae]
MTKDETINTCITDSIMFLTIMHLDYHLEILIEQPLTIKLIYIIVVGHVLSTFAYFIEVFIKKSQTSFRYIIIVRVPDHPYVFCSIFKKTNI